MHWSTPSRDGITVRFDGAEETLIVLWGPYTTSVGTIGRLCELLLEHEPDLGDPDPHQVFVRDGDELNPARISITTRNDGMVAVEILRDQPGGPVIVTAGTYPSTELRLAQSRP